jgi:endonuclease YncB( thermonuclease family)
MTTQFSATVRAVLDGDSFTCDLENGPEVFGGQPIIRECHVRVNALDCWESKEIYRGGVKVTKDEVAKGKAAIVFAKTLLTPGRRVTIIQRGADKYGRLLADVLLDEAGTAVDYAELMILAGHDRRQGPEGKR